MKEWGWVCQFLFWKTLIQEQFELIGIGSDGMGITVDKCL